MNELPPIVNISHILKLILAACSVCDSTVSIFIEEYHTLYFIGKALEKLLYVLGNKSSYLQLQLIGDNKIIICLDSTKQKKGVLEQAQNMNIEV